LHPLSSLFRWRVFQSHQAALRQSPGWFNITSSAKLLVKSRSINFRTWLFMAGGWGFSAVLLLLASISDAYNADQVGIPTVRRYRRSPPLNQHSASGDSAPAERLALPLCPAGAYHA
jgi:hypothetical protein